MRSPELDRFVQKTIAEAPISTVFSMSCFMLCVVFAFYMLELHKYGGFALAWLGAHFIDVGINFISYSYLKWRKNRGISHISFSYLTMIIPVITGSLLWGILPFFIIESSGIYIMVYMIGTFVIIFANSSWILGLTWLSFLYALIGTLPFLTYVYVNDVSFSNIAVLAFCFCVTSWFAAHTIATGVINNAAQQFILSEQTKLIENLLNEFQINSSDWVWETDEHNLIKFISIVSAESQIHVTDRDLINSKFIKIFDDADLHVSTLESYLYRQEPFDQLKVSIDPQLSGGDKKTWALRGRPIFDEKKQFVGFRGFGREITNIQKLNDLNNSKDKFDIMSKFVAKIAHDFNNSLMIIQSSIEILGHNENEILSNDGKEVINTVKEVVKSASRVNRELLSYARKEVLCPKTVDLYSVLIDLTKKYKMRAPDVEFIVKPFKPSLVHTDQYALVRTLENLLMNSIEAMNYIGTISITGTNMDWGKGSQIVFRIEDNGSGFSVTALKSASEPFFTTKKQMGGGGAGAGNSDRICATIGRGNALGQLI